MTQETTDLVVQTDVLIDKNDIVAVAVANAEMRIRNNIKEYKEKIQQAKDDIDATAVDFNKIGEDLINKKFKQKFQMIKAKIQKAKLNLTAKMDIDIHDISHYYVKTEHKETPNSVSIYILPEEDAYERVGSGQYINVLTESVLITKLQIALIKKRQELKEFKNELTETGAQWKYKLSDIPAIERQMRAKVAEAEMKKTKTGQAVLKSMMDNLDDTIKMIG